MRPLEGLKVIDLSTVVMGPYASQTLADFGAEVIKIEPPEGDSTRRTGPANEEGMAAIFLGVNRSKRSVVLDLKQPEGQATLLKLVSEADVFMHSMRPHKAAGLGITYERYKTANPALIYVTMHGFGLTGPYAKRPAYDDVIQGMSGLAAIMEMQIGEPVYFPTIAADKVSGLYAATAILAAVAHHHKTGAGALVEVPMFEAMVGFNLVEHLYGEHFVPPLASFGYSRVMSPWRKPYKTSNGYLCIMPYTDRHWRDLFIAADLPEYAADLRFASIASRTANIAELYQLLADIIQTRDTASWLALCEERQIPAAPMNRLPDVLTDPHLVETAFFEIHHDKKMGDIRYPGVAARFDGERQRVSTPPRLGEHTEEILSKIGARRVPQDEQSEN